MSSWIRKKFTHAIRQRNTCDACIDFGYHQPADTISLLADTSSALVVVVLGTDISALFLSLPIKSNSIWMFLLLTSCHSSFSFYLVLVCTFMGYQKEKSEIDGRRRRATMMMTNNDATVETPQRSVSRSSQRVRIAHYQQKTKNITY